MSYYVDYYYPRNKKHKVLLQDGYYDVTESQYNTLCLIESFIKSREQRVCLEINDYSSSCGSGSSSNAMTTYNKKQSKLERMMQDEKEEEEYQQEQKKKEDQLKKEKFEKEQDDPKNLKKTLKTFIETYKAILELIQVGIDQEYEFVLSFLEHFLYSGKLQNSALSWHLTPTTNTDGTKTVQFEYEGQMTCCNISPTTTLVKFLDDGNKSLNECQLKLAQVQICIDRKITSWSGFQRAEELEKEHQNRLKERRAWVEKIQLLNPSFVYQKQNLDQLKMQFESDDKEKQNLIQKIYKLQGVTSYNEKEEKYEVKKKTLQDFQSLYERLQSQHKSLLQEISKWDPFFTVAGHDTKTIFQLESLVAEHDQKMNEFRQEVDKYDKRFSACVAWNDIHSSSFVASSDNDDTVTKEKVTFSTEKERSDHLLQRKTYIINTHKKINQRLINNTILPIICNGKNCKWNLLNTICFCGRLTGLSWSITNVTDDQWLNQFDPESSVLFGEQVITCYSSSATATFLITSTASNTSSSVTATAAVSSSTASNTSPFGTIAVSSTSKLDTLITQTKSLVQEEDHQLQIKERKEESKEKKHNNDFFAVGDTIVKTPDVQVWHTLQETAFNKFEQDKKNKEEEKENQKKKERIITSSTEVVEIGDDDWIDVIPTSFSSSGLFFFFFFFFLSWFNFFCFFLDTNYDSSTSTTATTTTTTTLPKPTPSPAPLPISLT
jgi:hypothetical protein